MKAKDVPPIQQALADLSRYFSMFYDVFEAGIDHGKSYFEWAHSPYNPWLHANLVRNYVKNSLDGHDLKTDFESETLPNSGLQLTVKPWFIRIRKSLNGEIPSPGRSSVLQAFYKQGQLLLPGDFSDMHNLLLLWKANAGGDFLGLSLVYPLSLSIMKWRVDIPHPAQSTELTTTYQATFEELGDLPIEPLEDAENDDLQAEEQ